MRHNQRVFSLLFIFFIVVALGSILILDGDFSVFDRSSDYTWKLNDKEHDIDLDNDLHEDVLTEREEGIQDAVTEQTMAIHEDLKAAKEAETEEFDDESETVTEKEPDTEEEPAAEAETQSQVEIKYYTYTTDTMETSLRLREQPSTDAEILAKLPKGSKGYILKPGNEWCYCVTSDGNTGYLFTRYLIAKETSKNSFPKEFQDKVEAPDEELDDRFLRNG